MEPSSLTEVAATEQNGAQQASESNIPDTTEGGADDSWRLERTRRKEKEQERQRQEQRRSWLMGDPQGWVGRKVRSRRNFAIYMVSEVFRNGRVKLERNWMTYLTDAESVRTQYDTAS